MSEDLPLPERPQMASLVPGGICRETEFRAGGPSFLGVLFLPEIFIQRNGPTCKLPSRRGTRWRRRMANPGEAWRVREWEIRVQCRERRPARALQPRSRSPSCPILDEGGEPGREGDDNVQGHADGAGGIHPWH